MTRGEIKTLVLSWLDDAASTYFTDSNLNVWCNQAQKQVQMMLLQAGQNYYMKPVESLLVINQSDYALPSDFMVEHRLEVVLSGTGVNENRLPLEMITTMQQDFLPITSGDPTAYLMKKDRVTLFPTPRSALTLRLYYSPRVADLGSDSDTPDVPEQYMEYVAILTAYNGFIKDDRVPNNILAKKTDFEMILKKMAETRIQDKPRSIVYTSEWDSGTFY